MEEEKPKSRKENLEKDRRKRRYERVKSIDSEDVYDRYADERWEKRREKDTDRRRMDRERKKISDSEEEGERYKRRKKEKERGLREHERDRGKYQKTDRLKQTENNEESNDDVKRDLKLGRKQSDDRYSRQRDDDGEKKTREEEVEHVQKKLDEEVEKQRRRLHEWQELKIGKRRKLKVKVSLGLLKENMMNEQTDVHGDTKPEDGGDAKMVDLENAVSDNGIEDEEVIDPLDAFMNTMVLPEVEKLSNAASPLETCGTY